LITDPDVPTGTTAIVIQWDHQVTINTMVVDTPN
jgi:hypothetical protein